MQNGKHSQQSDDNHLNGIAVKESDNLSKFNRGIQLQASLEKQKSIVVRQSLVAKIEQIKADIEAKKLELIELKEKLMDL